jgi:hypothetical protein
MRPLPILLMAVVVLVLPGCLQDQPEPAPRPNPYPATSGRRVIIEGSPPNTTPELEEIKIRRRRHHYKVYGPGRIAEGTVRWSHDDQGRFVVEQRRLDGTASTALVSTDDDAFNLGDHLRLERIERGWAIFDERAQLLALIDYQDPKGWQLRKSYTDRESWTAVVEGDVVTLRHGQRTMRTLPADLFAPTGALALAIGDLSSLDAVSLALWLPHHLDAR